MEYPNQSIIDLLAEIQSLRDRVTISEEIVQAIQQGEVDALVISTPQGRKVFTLQSADLSYRLLVEEMQQGAVILSTEGLILYCNKSFANLLKEPLEKLIGSYFHRLIYPQDTHLFQARVEQAERGERHPVELFMNTHDGVEIPVYLSINHLLLDDTPIDCLVITDLSEQKRHKKTLAAKNELEIKVIERTQELQETNDRLELELLERKQLEQDLAIQQAWLNAFFTYSPVGMAILDNQLRFVQVNENAAQMSNLTIDRHLGKSIEELFPSWFPILQPIYQQVLNTGQSLFNVEVEGDDPRHPGSIGYWLVSYHPILNLTRQVIGVGYVAIDISDRKRAESEVRELNLALENAVEGIARLDAQGRYISVNRAYTEKCGYQLSEMLGMEWPPTVHPEDRPKMLAAYQEMLTKGKVETEAKGLRKDGSTFYKQLVMICAYDKENNFVGHYCFMKDITERKQAQVELAAAKEAAEAANRAKSEFLANMSHEIRTPMNAILGFSELLQGSIADPQSLGYLNSIAVSGKTLLALINDILDLSKIEAGKLQLEYEPVDVRSLIREIQQILDQTALKKSLSLLVEIDETLPKAILFDPVRLRQILFNTVGNALKFTEAGFVKISVRAQLETSTLSNRVQIEITVADTGIGICFDQQESIFEAFKQSEGQSTRKYGGTGLGLAITKRLTEMLGGRVELQSELGKGSAFTFIFPNLTIAESQTQSVMPSKLDEDLNQFLTATVLVVDDVKYNLDLIAGYFAGSKHRLLFAGDGQEAIEVAQTNYPDVILMDLWMPNMDGLQATQLLKQDEKTKNIPIAILTAVSRPEDEAIVLSLSQAFLRKPVSRSQLVSALKQILPQEASYFPVDEMPITSSQIEQIIPNPNAEAKLPELVEKLRQEEESTWLELCKTMKRRDIQLFIERLREWAHEYQCQPLLNYMTTLESQLAAFDWDKIPKTIAKFPEVRLQLL